MSGSGEFSRSNPEIGTILLATPPNFSLVRAVCSYGFFLLAPNKWTCGTFRRPLWINNQTCCLVEISQNDSNENGEKTGGVLRINIQKAGNTSLTDEERVGELITSQVVRMLRLDLDLNRWFEICPKAGSQQFGWLFRSPSLFEDMVKTICTCNTNWKRTTTMCIKLCQIAKISGSFPEPEDIMAFSVKQLQELAGLGYRALWIRGYVYNQTKRDGRNLFLDRSSMSSFRLAKHFVDKTIDVDFLENPYIESNKKLFLIQKLQGFGPFAAANVLQLLNHFDHLPLDSETVR